MTMKKIKTAVVGVGRLGAFHAEKYAGLERSELIGVSDIDAARASEVAGALGVKVFPDYRELLPIVDAVSIATPTEHHLKIGEAFLKKGINVLVEKPIAMDSAEAGVMVEAARATGALLQVGHLERFNPAVVALNGRLHNPLYIESYRLSPFPARSTDIDVILDLMIHDIDIILNLVGDDPVDIKAMGIPVLTKHVDMANARLRFAGGCVANVTASRVSRERTRNIRIFQNDSIIAIDYAAQSISITRPVKSSAEGPGNLVDEEIDIEKKDSLLEEVSSFIDVCLAKRPPLVTGEAGKRALLVAERIQESVRKSMARFPDYHP